MKTIKIFGKSFMFLIMTLVIFVPAALAVENYGLTFDDVEKGKKYFDDPTPYLTTTLSYKKMIPPDIYNKLKFDVKAMQDAWAEVVGFRAPDVVGKIAPEIKPGKYSYKDKDKFPGLKELMTPHHYKMFKPGGPPFVGNFSEMEIIPTKQYYYALPLAEASKKHKGKTKLDENGLLIPGTYVSGHPFPRPEGKFMGNQIIYNFLKKFWGGEEYHAVMMFRGFDKNLRQDTTGLMYSTFLRVCGRAITEPYGWYDERARKQDEADLSVAYYVSPRDQFGNVLNVTNYNAPDKFDRLQVYVNVLRRVRSMSATDIQDANGGADAAYCDQQGFFQKPTKNVWPYTVTVTEREYLLPAYQTDGSEYFSSKGVERCNLRFQRRPIYVAKVVYLDKNFIYSYRNLYIDKETFLLSLAENYDQKGRIYRTSDLATSFDPEMGYLHPSFGINTDYIDMHSMAFKMFYTPALWLNRTDFGFEGISRFGK